MWETELMRLYIQSILKEISPEYSLEGQMLKLKLQYFGHPMQRTDSLKKTLMLGKIEGRRGRTAFFFRGWDGWIASPTSWTWVSASSGSWWRTGNPGVLQSVMSQRVRHNWVIEPQQYAIRGMQEIVFTSRRTLRADFEWGAAKSYYHKGAVLRTALY